MKKVFPFEFAYQLVSLIVTVIIVHALYVLVVRPRAAYVTAEQVVRMQSDKDAVQERSIYVIIRDFEQEACFVLMLWAFAIMTYKSVAVGRERKLLEADLRSARMHDANLEEADLTEANLSEASMHKANCEGCNFTRAVMERTRLDGVNLAQADLREADMRGSRMLEARIAGARMTGARLAGAEVSPEQERSHQSAVEHHSNRASWGETASSSASRRGDSRRPRALSHTRRAASRGRGARV